MGIETTETGQQRPDLWMDLAEFSRRRRLFAVSRLGILDRTGDPVLTSMVRLARSVTGASSAAIHIFDEHSQRRIAAVNAPLLSLPAQDSLCRSVLESGEAIITADATREPRFGYSSLVQGETPVRFYASLPLVIAGQTTIGTLCAFDPASRELSAAQTEDLQDVANLVRAHLELMELATDLGRQATEDDLTGVSSRAFFDSVLARALEEGESDGEDVLVALIDIDHFKAINDTHGHARGDAALRWVAARLVDLLGPGAVVGRIGGDEFAVLLRGSGERIQRLIEAMATVADGFEPPFEISVGAAPAAPGDDVPTLMRRADKRMYEAKAGRRRARAGDL